MVYAVVGEIGAGSSFERWLVEVFSSLKAAEQHRAVVQERADKVGVEIRYLTEAIVTSQGDDLRD